MKMKKAQALTLIAGLMVASMAPAAHAAAEVKMGGLMFAQYLYNLDHKTMAPSGNSSTKGRNSFDLTRVYINTDVKFDDNWKAKAILEARTDTTTGSSAFNVVFLKGAFLEYGNLMDTGANVQFGQIPLSWDAFEGGVHNRRYVMQQFPNRYMSLATWDKGVGVYGKLPAGFGDYNAQVFNGNGETATEGSNGNTGRTKAASLLMSIVPVPNMEALSPLRLNAFVQQEKQGLVDGSNVLMPSREKNYWFAGASYKTKNWHAMGTYYNGNVASGTPLATNAHTRPKGYSLHGSFSGLPWETTVFLRRDRFDAGVNQAPSTVAYAPRVVHVVGLEKKMADGVRFAIADTMDYTRNVGANTSTWLHTLGLYAEAKF